MVQLIVGEKGKGKTKILLGTVNSEVTKANGNIVYVDKSMDHMFELNNKVRLINVKDYPITNPDEFVGFILGIVSQDHDLEQMYFDSFLKIAHLENDEQLIHTVEKLDALSEKYSFKIVASVSKDEVNLPQEVKGKIIESL